MMRIIATSLAILAGVTAQGDIGFLNDGANAPFKDHLSGQPTLGHAAEDRVCRNRQLSSEDALDPSAKAV